MGHGPAKFKDEIPYLQETSNKIAHLSRQFIFGRHETPEIKRKFSFYIWFSPRKNLTKKLKKKKNSKSIQCARD